MSIGLAGSDTLKVNLSGLSIYGSPLSRAERTPEVVAVSGVYRGRPGGEESSPGIPQTNLTRTATAVLDRPLGTPQKPTEKDDLLGYLDCIDKGIFGEAKSCLPPSVKKCGQWSAVGQCENGHRFRKILYCGKPYHADCRDIIHRRKIARCLSKVQQFEAMGYWVIRPPWELMPLLRSKKSRAWFTTRCWKALEAVGYRRGGCFKHDFGEKSTKYAFHFNALVDGEYLEPEVLDDLCRKLRRLIYPRSVIRKWGDKLAVHYSYKKTRAEMMQALSYCTKPTFKDIDWDRQLADALNGERYSVWWGRWDESPKWQLDESAKKLQSLVSLEKGICPKCGRPVIWDKHPLPSLLIDLESPVDIGNGYGILSTIRPPPAGRRQPTNLIELPDGDYRKHPNAVRRSIDRARELISRREGYESYS